MIIEKVRKNFDFLFERGFDLSSDENNPDDWTIVIAFGVLTLRITQDRSDWFVDVGFSFKPGHWYELWDILALLKEKGVLQYEYTFSNKINGLRAILKACIEDMLQVDCYKDKLSTLTPV